MECGDRQAEELAPRPRLSGPTPANFPQGAHEQDSFRQEGNASAQDSRARHSGQMPDRFDLRMQASALPVPLVL